MAKKQTATKKTATARKPAVKGASTKTVKRSTSKKPVAKRTAVGTTSKKPVKKTGAVANSDLFKGATEVSLTDSKIAVTRKKTKSTGGKFSQSEVRTYHEKTPSNMRALREELGKRKCRKVTVSFK